MKADRPATDEQIRDLVGYLRSINAASRP